MSAREAVDRRHDSIARSVANLAAGEVALRCGGIGYVIRRAWGGQAGPFSTYQDAAHYLNPGDEIIVFNEHGNVIDYGAQFDADDG